MGHTVNDICASDVLTSDKHVSVWKAKGEKEWKTNESIHTLLMNGISLKLNTLLIVFIRRLPSSVIKLYSTVNW